MVCGAHSYYCCYAEWALWPTQARVEYLSFSCKYFVFFLWAKKGKNASSSTPQASRPFAIGHYISIALKTPRKNRLY